MKLISRIRSNWKADTAEERRISRYLREGRRPFSEGYGAFRRRFVRQVLNDDALMGRFLRCESLPAGYGEFLDERVVEYPWLFARLSRKESRLLDAGSTLNQAFLLDHQALKTKQMFILNLEPEPQCFWRDGISYVFEDLRDLPFKDDFFETVVCVSTLEHVGMDNTLLYTADPRHKMGTKEDYLKAVKELRRVLKPGGSCFVTVPFGRFQDDVFQQQFTVAMVGSAKEVFGPRRLTEVYYRYADGGWNVSTQAECRDCAYFNVHQTKYFDKTSSRDYDEDRAAAARAVAALELVK